MTTQPTLEELLVALNALYDLEANEYWRRGDYSENHKIIRAVLTAQQPDVNQELLEALKEAVRLWDEHKATHEYHITSWKQALAKAGV